MMHIGIIGGGTRGDVQPCIALGKGLHAAGYTVTVIAGRDSAEWIQSHGLEFADLGVDIRAIMSGDAGRDWVNSSPMMELSNMKKTFMSAVDPLIDSLVALLPQYDAVITGLTMMPMALPITQSAGTPLLNLLFAPAYPTKSGAANMIALRPKANSRLNLLARPMMLRAMWYTASDGVRMTCERLGIPTINYSDFAAAWMNTPTLIAVNPHIVPPPPDYPPHVHVTGFLFLKSQEDETWTPPPGLTAFLDAGPPPVYIGFGSMTGSNSRETISTLIEALDGRRGIINRGWSGMDSVQVPDSVYLLDGAPHQWLFPRMGAVVHHGGAGTTAAGLHAGVPTVIVPHMADQPYYGRRVMELGVGPAPVPRQQLNAQRLHDAITIALTDEAMRDSAQQISQQMAAETGVENAIAVIRQYV